MKGHDEGGRTPDLIAIRLAMAQADLNEAEAVDLATASNAGLVTLVEKLRDSLTDVIAIVRRVGDDSLRGDAETGQPNYSPFNR